MAGSSGSLKSSQYLIPLVPSFIIHSPAFKYGHIKESAGVQIGLRAFTRCPSALGEDPVRVYRPRETQVRKALCHGALGAGRNGLDADAAAETSTEGNARLLFIAEATPARQGM